METENEKLKMMRDGKMSRALLSMGAPTMLGMLASALYNVVDAYFVSGLGTPQLGAVSVAFPIGQVVIGLAMTFGSGAASYIARLLGAGETGRARRVAATSLYGSLLAGGILITAALCLLDPILTALGATATILPYARAYGLIYVAGSILTVFCVTMNNIVTAEGAVRLSMTAMMIGTGLNAALDPLFIYAFGWGVEGAAIATVAAQACSTFLYVVYILRGKGALRFSPRHFSLDPSIYAEVIKVGVSILVVQLLTGAALGLTNTAASRYGDSAIAAMGIVTRIFTLGSYVIFGFVKGFQPIAGYNYGARNYPRVKQALRLSLMWTTLFCTAAALVMIVLPRSIVSAFSAGNAEVLDIGSRALRANGILFPFFGFQIVTMTLFLALGKAAQGGGLGLCRQGIFFLPAIFALPSLFGLNGVVWAQPLADLLTIILTAVLAVQARGMLKSAARAAPR
jgi:putative MATE family efflux protein